MEKPLKKTQELTQGFSPRGEEEFLQVNKYIRSHLKKNFHLVYTYSYSQIIILSINIKRNRYAYTSILIDA